MCAELSLLKKERFRCAVFFGGRRHEATLEATHRRQRQGEREASAREAKTERERERERETA